MIVSNCSILNCPNFDNGNPLLNIFILEIPLFTNVNHGIDFPTCLPSVAAPAQDSKNLAPFSQLASKPRKKEAGSLDREFWPSRWFSMSGF